MMLGFLSQVPYADFNHLASTPNLVISEAVFIVSHETSYQSKSIQSGAESKFYNPILTQLTQPFHVTDIDLQQPNDPN
jgi:hypothetical protein